MLLIFTPSGSYTAYPNSASLSLLPNKKSTPFSDHCLLQAGKDSLLHFDSSTVTLPLCLGDTCPTTHRASEPKTLLYCDTCKCASSHLLFFCCLAHSLVGSCSITAAPSCYDNINSNNINSIRTESAKGIS